MGEHFGRSSLRHGLLIWNLLTVDSQSISTRYPIVQTGSYIAVDIIGLYLARDLAALTLKVHGSSIRFVIFTLALNDTKQ